MRDYDDTNFDADEIDPTGGWGTIGAGGGYVAADCDVDSEAEWNDERQPAEAQEWHDFDPDC